MSYKVKQIKKRFFVVNTETNEVIEMPMQRQEANDLARKLNLGRNVIRNSSLVKILKCLVVKLVAELILILMQWLMLNVEKNPQLDVRLSLVEKLV